MDSRDVLHLKELLPGRVLEPGDGSYDEARLVFYRGYDNHPAVIVRPQRQGRGRSCESRRDHRFGARGSKW